MTDAVTLGLAVAFGPNLPFVVVVGDKSVAVGDGVVVGSADSADVKVDDASVSRRHVRLVPRGNRLRVVDEDSKNGVFIGDVRVYDVDVKAPALLRLGRAEIQIDVARKAPDAGVAAAVSFGAFSTVTPSLARWLDGLHKAAFTDATVLLEGESGTGKELLAEALHDHSARKAGPFVVVDCGALAPSLIEAELFGHEKGAFTGADKARDGAFVQAAKGTVFLDEVGELPLALQTRLLGVLERKQVKPLGAGAMVDVDVRVVAATHRNLEREVEEGRFRLDLFHRLAVVHRRIPALRDRPADVLHLADRFARDLGAGDVVDPAVKAMLLSLRLPGNARELKNLVERLSLFGKEALPEPASTSNVAFAVDDVAHLVEAGMPYSQARGLVLERFTERYVEEMLKRHGGNVTAAANAAGIARRHFHRLKRR